MTTQNPVSSKGTSHKRPINKFLFEVVNSFTLAQFKRYTNFPEAIRTAVMLKMEKQPDVPDPFSLHDRIRHNFKKLPDENWWKRGLFNSLKLKAKFYRSDLAKRIFEKMYGLKSCAVRIELPTKRVALPTESRHSVNLKERLEVPSQIEPTPSDEFTINNSSPKRLRLKYPRQKVQTVVSMTKSRTKSSIHSTPLETRPNEDNVVAVPLQIESFDDKIGPKRQVKHPGKRKRTDVSMTKSGIRSHTSTSKFAEQRPTSPHPEGFNDENFISPTEPAPVSSKRDTIISDIVLVPATPFRDEIVRHQLPDSNLQSKRNRPSKRNIGPVKRIHQRGVVYEEETEELSVRLPLTDVSNERLQNLSKSKSKAGRNSRVTLHKNSLADSQPNTTQHLLQDLMCTNPVPILTSDKSPNKVSEVPTERFQEAPSKVGAPPRKPRIGRKSVMSNRLNINEKSAKQSKSKNTPAKQHSNETSLPRAQIKSKSTNNTDITETPHHVQQTYPLNELHVEPQGDADVMNDLPVEFVYIIESDALTQHSDSLRLEDKFKQSVERASKHLQKYVAEVDPNLQSIKQFWYDFLKTEYKGDSSAAQTQLFVTYNGVESKVGTQNDVKSEVKSQAILHSNQLNAEEEQMTVLPSQVDQVEAQMVDEVHNVNEIKVEPESLPVVQLDSSNSNKFVELQSPADDPHPVQSVEHFKLIPENEIKVEKVSNDHNETYSSDVQIIELPADEPIEIQDDTADLFDILQVHGNDSEDLCLQLAISAPTSKSAVADSSRGRVTEFNAFSLQHVTHPPNENYQIAKCNMTESQCQRYALLNDENSMFLSSQLDNYAFNTAKIPDRKSALMATDCIAKSPLVLKRLSQNGLNQPVNKRKRPNDTVKRGLHWKIMDLRSITFKPLGNYTFHLEMQLCNDYDTFHIRDQSSIKRILHLSNDEWKQVAKVLTTLNGYRYDSSAAVTTTRAADLLSSVMDCFVRSVPIFVRSNIQFQDFMGHCLEVSEPQPLRNVCVDAAIDPNILKKMGELKRQLNGEN